MTQIFHAGPYTRATHAKIVHSWDAGCNFFFFFKVKQIIKISVFPFKYFFESVLDVEYNLSRWLASSHSTTLGLSSKKVVLSGTSRASSEAVF